MLLYGQAGIGKRLLGRALSRALLCESPDPAKQTDGGCGVCPACVWFDQGNHPDFRRLVPEAVAVAEGLELGDDAADADGVEPEPAASRSKRAPSKEIKADQVRALQGFFTVATHRTRHRVVLLYPLETLNDVAANALLKVLEEPPSRTVFVIVADHLGRIPATLLSRCQKTFVASPDPATAAAWLAARDIPDAAAVLALAGGAPLAALALAADDQALATHRALLDFLERPDAGAAMAAAEALAKAPSAALIRWMQQWLADCVGMRLAGRIRYHPAQSKVIARLVSTARPEALMALMQRLDAIRRTIDHPLNGRLLLESLFTAYADLLDPTKAEFQT